MGTRGQCNQSGTASTEAPRFREAESRLPEARPQPTFGTRVPKEVPLQAAQDVEDLPVVHGPVPVFGEEALSEALALPQGHHVDEVPPEAADQAAVAQQLSGRDVGEQFQ